MNFRMTVTYEMVDGVTTIPPAPPVEFPVEVVSLVSCNCAAPDPDPEALDACLACGGLI